MEAVREGKFREKKGRVEGSRTEDWFHGGSMVGIWRVGHERGGKLSPNKG